MIDIMIALPCVNHRERAGIGKCVRCNAVICFECSTRRQGINYCVQCLKRIEGGLSKTHRLSFGSLLFFLLSIVSIPLLYWAFALTIEIVADIFDISISNIPKRL